jgi:hypothetical protein
MGGDTATLLAAAQGMFAGHVLKDTTVVELFEPGELPWLPRATAIILLWPEHPGSRCGIVDLRHPSESGTPRCKNPDCRCHMEKYL